MKRFLITLCLVALGTTATAQAMSAKDMARCKAMGATLPTKQVEIKSATTKRDVLAEQVEALGLAWDDVEIHRQISASHGQQADHAEATYTEAKGSLLKADHALQANLKMFNQDVAAFNMSCVTKKK